MATAETAEHGSATSRIDAAGVLETVAQIGQAKDTPAAIRLLKQAASRMGLGAAVFTSFVRDDATMASYRFLLACDPVWGLHYAQHHWCTDDPWLRYALYNTEPISSEQLPLLGHRQREIVESAANFGFASALIIPVPSPAAQSRVGLLCVGTEQQGFFAKGTSTGMRPLARALAMELGDWMHRQVRGELMAHARITDDDLMLLRHEQLGNGSKAIAAALNLEPKTIDSRFHRLCMKLGSANRRAAVRLAELYGLI